MTQAQPHRLRAGVREPAGELRSQKHGGQQRQVRTTELTGRKGERVSPSGLWAESHGAAKTVVCLMEPEATCTERGWQVGCGGRQSTLVSEN